MIWCNKTSSKWTHWIGIYDFAHRNQNSHKIVKTIYLLIYRVLFKYYLKYFWWIINFVIIPRPCVQSAMMGQNWVTPTENACFYSPLRNKAKHCQSVLVYLVVVVQNRKSNHFGNQMWFFAKHHHIASSPRLIGIRVDHRKIILTFILIYTYLGNFYSN